MRHLLVALLLIAVTACGGGQNSEESTASGPPEIDTGGGAGSVEVADFSFEPAELEVASGDTVTWTYGEEDGDSVHTVTFDDGEDSGELNPGDTYERTFAEAGEFPYACFFHPSMTATVSVAE